MKLTIPSTIGLLTLCAGGAGCSDAERVANAIERLCKADCECPDQADRWQDPKNCKKQCRADSLYLAAQIADNEAEPCDELDQRIKEANDCRKRSCEAMDECYWSARWDLLDCANGYGTIYTYGDDLEFGSELEVDERLGAEQLATPIPDGGLELDAGPAGPAGPAEAAEAAEAVAP